jgi:hypothetical protein
MAWRVLVWALLTGLFGVACRNGQSGPDGVQSLTGVWTGTVTDSGAGTGALSLTLTQVAVGVTGTWSVTFPGTTANRSGSVGGTLGGSVISLFLTPSVPLGCGLSGTLAVSATLENGRLSGTYVAFDCTDTTTGSLDVSRH